MRTASIFAVFAATGLVLGGCASDATGTQGSGYGTGDDGGGTSSSGSGGGSSTGSGSGVSSSSGSGSGSGGSSSGASSSGSGSSGSGGGSGSGSSSGSASGSGSGGGSGSGSGSGSSSGSGSGSGSGGGNVPTIGGCQLFPADNAWNQRVDSMSLNANSATYIANMAPTTHLHPDWGDWSTDHYGIPWQTVPGSQAMVPMTFQYADESDPGPYPFPANALVEGGAGSGGDMHVLVLDTGSCKLYETWDSTYSNPGWSCGSGALFDLTSNALRPDGWTSADAAGLPVLPGLVKVSEVNAGAINHALRFTMNSTYNGYIHPATHAAGSSNTSLPPMGLRLRLKASFDLSSYSGPSLVILTAMKQYGLILADNGSNWFISGDSDDGWSSLMDQISSDFSKVTGNDFEVVDTGPVSTAGL